MTAAIALAKFDIVFTVLSHSGIYESARLREVDRLWADVGDKRLAIAFSPTRLIGGFVHRVSTFRAFMAYRDIILAGARVLDAFEPLDSSIVSPHTPLEIMVQQEMGMDMCRYFTREGYRLKEPRFHPPTRARFAAALGLAMHALFFPPTAQGRKTKPYVSEVVRMTRGDCIVDIVFTIGSPLIALFKSGCTLRFNFATWEHVYSVFPIPTLRDKRGVASDYGEREDHLDLEVFGFDALRTRSFPKPLVPDSLPAGDRWVGDKGCWRRALPPLAELRGRPSEFNWDANGVKIEYSLDRSKDPTAGMTHTRCDVSCVVLRDPSLQGWDYAVPPGFTGEFTHLLQRSSEVHGLFWRYRRFGPSVNALLSSFVTTYKMMWKGMPKLEDGMPDLVDA